MSTPPYEVPDADIWVGATAPTAAQPEDFWFDTSKVPLFGIDIIGQIPGSGPPVAGVPPVPTTPPDPGDAWWDGDGNIWVWDGDSWENMGNFQGPSGATGPTGPAGEGIDLQGSITGSGPPSATAPGVPPGYVPEDGDAWLDGDGVIWVWSSEPPPGAWAGAQIPVGPTGPTGPVAAFNIVGELPGMDGLPDFPPVPPATGGTAPGDAWLDPDNGLIWVWNGTGWTPMPVAPPVSGLPTGGNPGDILVMGPWPSGSTGPTGPQWINPGTLILGPTLPAWVETANWSYDGINEY